MARVRMGRLWRRIPREAEADFSGPFPPEKAGIGVSRGTSTPVSDKAAQLGSARAAIDARRELFAARSGLAAELARVAAEQEYPRLAIWRDAPRWVWQVSRPDGEVLDCGWATSQPAALARGVAHLAVWSAAAPVSPVPA